MKELRFWLLTIIVIGGSIAWFKPSLFASLGPTKNEYKLVEMAWKNQKSNLVVQVKGKVTLELPDIEDHSTYQRFLIVLENKRRVLVSHDIGIASPVNIAVGSEVTVKGEYDWTAEGGVIHWTHRDPAGKREGGWIELDGIRHD